MAIGKIIVEIGGSIKPLKRSLDQAERSMRRSGRRLASIGTELSTTLTLPIIGIGAASIKAAADFERLEKGMTAVMGSAEGAREEIDRLQKVAEAPGLGFEQAIAGSMRLQAVGMSADEARNTLGEMGNAIAMAGGTAQDLDGVTVQLTQMIAKGRVLQQDFRILQERMPKITDAMETAFGTRNIEDIREMGIGAREFIAGITAAMSEMPRVEGGLSNSLENIRITAKVAFAEIGNAINENLDIQGTVEKLGRSISKAIEWFGSLSTTTKKTIITIAGIVAVIGPVMKVIGSVKLLGATLAGLAANPVGLIITAIGLVVAALVTWEKKSGGVSATLAGLGRVATKLGQILIDSLKAPLEAIAHIQDKEFGKAAQKMAAFFTDKSPLGIAIRHGKDLVNAFSDGYNESITKFNAERKKIEEQSGEEAANANVSGYLDEFKSQFEASMPDLEETGAKTGEAVSKGMIESVKQFNPIQALNLVPDSIQRVTKDFIKLGVAIPDGIRKGIETGASGLAASIENIFNFILSVDYSSQFKAIGEQIVNGVQMGMQAFQALDDFMGAIFANRQASIDATYEKERQRIEATKMSEEQKQRALQKLDEQTDQKRRKLARKQAIREKILGIVSATINTAKAVASALPNLVLAAIVAALGGAQIAAIASTPIPALAKGGLAFGPSMAMVGDNPNANINPEVIAPLDKLRDLIGGNTQRVEVVGRISGRDLILVQERAGMDMNRTRGY